ncbi:MAG: J domain-containing protein [Archangiaceae bacterium]|nr:J domain-containing protein [Archangiaceae bacterium]
MRKAKAQRDAEEAAARAEEERLREQERAAAERLRLEDEQRRADEARLAAEREAEEKRLEQERLEREARERAEAEVRLAEQRRQYEEEQQAAADAAREMSPDGWFSPAPSAATMPTGPLKLSQPSATALSSPLPPMPEPVVEAMAEPVVEAVVEPVVEAVVEAEVVPEAVMDAASMPTLEAEVIEAEVEPSPPPSIETPVPSPARGPVPMEQALPSASEADRLNLAKHRAQADLLRELNEALRRSASGNAAAPAAPTAPVPPASTPTPVPAPAWSQPATQPMKQPLILGPKMAAEEEGSGDLWNLVKPASGAARPPGGVASFEEALKRVDASLEQLVEAPRPSGSEVPVEATVEAEAVVEPSDAAMEGDLADPSDPNEAAKARRQRLLRRAMENLGAMPAKAPASASATTDPDLQPVNVAPKVEPRASANTPKPTNDDLQLKAQVDKRWEELQKGRELYKILGVPLGGGKDQVKAAFLSLAKIFHPDRLPPSLPELAPKMQSVFESIREAYETLYDDARRASYMSALASGGARKPAGQPGPPAPTRASSCAWARWHSRSASTARPKSCSPRRTPSTRAARRWRPRPGPSTWTRSARPRPAPQSS